MHIRPATLEDQPALDTVVATAFDEEGGAVVSVMHALAASGAVRANLLAEHGGEPVGHVSVPPPGSPTARSGWPCCPATSRG